MISAHTAEGRDYTLRDTQWDGTNLAEVREVAGAANVEEADGVVKVLTHDGAWTTLEVGCWVAFSSAGTAPAVFGDAVFRKHYKPSE